MGAGLLPALRDRAPAGGGLESQRRPDDLGGAPLSAAARGVRFVFTFTVPNADNTPGLPRTIARFVDPFDVVCATEGEAGWTLLLFAGGHTVPVDGTVDIVWGKILRARTAPSAEPESEEDAPPSEPRRSDPSDPDFEPAGVEMMEPHDGPMQ